MFSIAWRLVLMVVLMPFAMFPLVNFIALPIEIYLVVSMSALIWRRTSRRNATE